LAGKDVDWVTLGIALFPVFIAGISLPRTPPFRILNNSPVSFLGVVS
jgi:hypothetical protein